VINSDSDHEIRIAKLEAARKELEDAFIVMTHLETKQSNVIKGLAETQAEFAARQVARQAELEEFEKRHVLRMSEFDEKLNALIDIVSRMQGGMESRPNQ
jgi:hypothetical protein